ncbi:unnamed protein product, partial [Rotaria sp. Silwood2]
HFDCVSSRRALSTTPSGATVQVLIHQRYSWRRDYWSSMCTTTTITNQQIIGSNTGNLDCNVGSCSSFITLSADVICTDYSTLTDCSSGEVYNTLSLPLGGTFIVGFYGGNWLALAIGGNGAWQVTGKIDLTVRSDGLINTSPVTTTLPVIYRTVGVQHVQIIPMSDADSTDTLRCRWSTDNTPSNANGYDECASVCAPSLPAGYTLSPDNCTLVFRISSVGGYYAVALQIEDFYTSTSPTPMSSVPVQFMFYGIAVPSGCSTPPSIIGVRPNLGAASGNSFCHAESAPITSSTFWVFDIWNPALSSTTTTTTTPPTSHTVTSRARRRLWPT